VIYFAHPEVLWLLALVPLFPLLRGKRGPAGSVRYSSAEIAREVAGARKSRAGQWLMALRMLAVALLLVALGRPQLVQGTTEVEASGIDILLAVDASSSMEAMDFKMNGQASNRIDAVKAVVAKFVEERPNDRIGLVAFAGHPYMMSPLTLDHTWLQKRLEDLEVGTVEDGTAIGSAIASSVNRLRDQDAKSKIVILLTDGMNNAGKVTPQTGAEAAEALGIKVYTIGAGSRGEAPMPVTDQLGNRRLVMAKVDIDEDTLKNVAARTGAKYFRATDTDSLQRIYEEINKLETTTRKVTKFERYTELFSWPAILALLFLGSELLLAQTKFRRLP
jgi:Ca-activated chloride channel family protein